MKILNITAVSVTIELINDDIYFSSDNYDVYLNNIKVYENINTNVFTIFDLTPNTEYEVEVDDVILKFKTLEVSKTIEVYPLDYRDHTSYLQNIIDNAPDNSLININDGYYRITSLFLKDNITINIKEKAFFKANIDVDKYKELDPYFTLKNGEVAILGTWEGNASKMKTSIINLIDVNNVNLVGKGTIDGQANLSSWWDNPKTKEYVRPHLMFLNHACNVNVIGLKLRNSPQWTIHPFFSSYVNFYNLDIENPKKSPNTDGLNPQCSDNINIIGVKFSVGDDCIAIKSGKIDLANKYKKDSENITIRNCLMQYGHGGIVLGSEMSGGIKNLTCERCYFNMTDRGLRIKTRRGRGKLGIIDGIQFDNIKMNHVLTPLVISMFYNCDPDGNSEYVYTKEKLPVDDRTPYLGKFSFNNIEAINCEYALGYFYGLPEMFIKEVNISNSTFSFKENASSGEPAMMSFAKSYSKAGFIFNNVENVNIENVKAEGYVGDLYILDGNKNFNRR